MGKFGHVIAALLCCLIAAPASAGPITLYRDKYGVPSVVAASLPDAVYALGYAMAQDDAVQMARNYKQARGRMAEVDGRSQLLQDGFLRALGVETLAEEKARTLSGLQGDAIAAFCAGANRALAEQKSRLPHWIEPFTPVDVLALAQLINAAFPLEDLAGKLLPGVGSNQFAVAPRRTANGHPILSADPHLFWSGVFPWYEFAIYTPEVQFRGVTLPGLPFGSMGHTAHVAWCMTNNDPRLYDFINVRTDADHPGQYSYYGEWRPFRSVTLDLRYRDGDALKTQQQTVRVTEWGPMVPFHSWAAHMTMLGAWDMLDEGVALATARNAAELRAALAPHGISMWNIVYADTEGHIGYQFNARMPHRDESLTWTPAVNGSDPRARYGPLWSNDELPHIEDPRSGVLCNCNSNPYLTPVDDELSGHTWPPDVTSYGHTTRYDRLSYLVSHDDQITPATARRYATDTLVPYAVAAIRALEGRSAVLRTGEQENRGTGERSPVRLFARSPVPHDSESVVDSAIKILAHWNGRADLSSRGAALYFYWLHADPRGNQELARKAAVGERWSAAERSKALDTLASAAAALQKDHGRLDVPWGDVHVTHRGNQKFALNGFHGIGEYSAVVPNWGNLTNGEVECVGGSSFRMIVELDPAGVRSWMILPHGESQDPSSPHYADQNALFGRGEYIETNFGVAGARKSAVTTQALQR